MIPISNKAINAMTEKTLINRAVKEKHVATLDARKPEL